ncbi:MAG: hypothetical protein ACKVHU_20135 [Acidimicrobiales bacterium]
MPTQTMDVDDNTIEAASLYIVDCQRGLHLLRPLLVGEECPSCGHWSTFHPDRIETEGAVGHKSFEHGHPAFPADIEKGLISIGLLDDIETDSCPRLLCVVQIEVVSESFALETMIEPVATKFVARPHVGRSNSALSGLTAKLTAKPVDRRVTAGMAMGEKPYS